MTQTLAPVIPLTPGATRVRRPSRRPGAVPASPSAFRFLGLLPETPEELSMATAIRAAAGLRLPAAAS